jgi:uncharacterized protein (DUF1800 family)
LVSPNICCKTVSKGAFISRGLPVSVSSIAINRFGLGASRGEVIPTEPKKWLLEQFERFEPQPATISAAPRSGMVAQQIVDFENRHRELRRRYGSPGQVMRSSSREMISAGTGANRPPAGPKANGSMLARPTSSDPLREVSRMARLEARKNYVSSVGARMNAALVTQSPFVERLVHFWANHFAISADKADLVGLAGTLEFEAIRPHVLGRFGDMLAAAERHPAMLIYLDQAVSVGPNSVVGRRVASKYQRKIGINENLAREILELHTVGVGAGYTQSDVTEFARAMTGWSVSGIGRRPGARLDGSEGPPGAFFFAANVHEPGERTIMGKRYPEAGEAQAAAVLADLAANPTTAVHLAAKLARHFAGDTPPKAMVERLKEAYLRSGGDLPTVYRAIVSSPEAWTEKPAKFKTPWEWIVSSYRSLGMKDLPEQPVVDLMDQLGQPVWKPGQPVGYDDIAASWAGPDAIMRRVEAAERMASRAPEMDVRNLATQLFPSALSVGTAEAVSRAESPSQALALLLVSPEMMRR